MKEAGGPLTNSTAPAISIQKLSDKNDDLTYWLAQPAEARVAALLHLRQQYSILTGMELTLNFENFIKLLNSHEVSYMVAGGFAVALYGYPRYTGDIDIWINPAYDNALKLLEVLRAHGYSEDEVTLQDLTTPDVVVQLGYPPNRLDLATGLAGIEFEACWENRVTKLFNNIVVHYISLSDLKQNKRATARQQDLLDLQNLPD